MTEDCTLEMLLSGRPLTAASAVGECTGAGLVAEGSTLTSLGRLSAAALYLGTSVRAGLEAVGAGLEAVGAGLEAGTEAVDPDCSLHWPLPANLWPGASGRREGCLEMVSRPGCTCDALMGSRAGR